MSKVVDKKAMPALDTPRLDQGLPILDAMHSVKVRLLGLGFLVGLFLLLAPHFDPGHRVFSTQASQISAEGQAIYNPLGLRARYCPNVRSKEFEVRRIERDFGCRVIRRLVRRTMSDDGYFQDGRYYCRWGGGGAGFPSKIIDGKRYYTGFCERKGTGTEVGFFGRLRGGR